MLDRIKKKEAEGFKDFVHNLETTALTARQQIILMGILEDPLYMGWILKNVKNFEDILLLPTEDLEKVLDTQDQILSIFTKCLAGSAPEKVDELSTLLPRHYKKIKEELSYFKPISQAERESASFFLLKTVRKLQKDLTIKGFKWLIPPESLFAHKNYPDGPLEITFESGIVAAVGEIKKGKRTGPWRHFFDTGKLLAEGEYSNGLKTGPWSIFYATGSIKAQGKYVTDSRHGMWKEWGRDNVVVEVEYVEGAKKN